MNITSTDTADINFDKKLVFDVIKDLAKYKRWWPKTILFKVIYENGVPCLWTRPFGGPGFLYRIKTFVENNYIEMEYGGGIYKGTGKWIIEEHENKVSLTYIVDTEIKNKLIFFVSKIINTEKIHKAMMKKVFAGLNNYLEKSK